MIQTGGYCIEDNSLIEMPEVSSIMGEFASNGFADNTLKHTKGVISMARTSDKNSATGQFFICAADCTFLDRQYAGFGKVTSGLEVVLEISKTETDRYDRPTDDVVIESITIDEKGGDYSYVEKIAEN